MVSVFLLGILRVSSFLLGRRLFGLVARWKRFEAHALFWALSVSKSQGWTNIVVEGDCKNIIDALNSCGQRGFHAQAIHNNCLYFRQLFSSVSFCFCFHNYNEVAHRLARWATFRLSDEV